MLTLKTPVSKLIGVGPKMAQRLKKLGIENVRDLIYYFPFRYDDFSNVIPIARVTPGAVVTIKGKILQIKNERSPRRRMFLTHALIQDKTGSIKVIWFNQFYLPKVIPTGTQVILAGKAVYDFHGLTLQNPAFEKLSAISYQHTTHVGRIVPVYPETAGLTSKWLRAKVRPLLKLVSQIREYLPVEILKCQNLINLNLALQQIHFPENNELLKMAKKRLGFDELFLLQLKLLKARQEWQQNTAPTLKMDLAAIKKLLKKLPFKLTNAQKKAAWEIIRDLEGSKNAKYKNQNAKLTGVPPMNRLLEGDVGSGKTIVAAIAMLVTAKNQMQSILMAPTEILAMQHFKNICKLLKGFGLKIALLTSGKRELYNNTVSSENASLRARREDLIKMIQEGEIDIVIGTHALITEKMSFKKLGLAIVDEQHRFGVRQRALLRQKAEGRRQKYLTPHLLSMTATPIPRTLSLAMYGDLDISVLDEMPAGRQQIITRLVPLENRSKAYKFITAHIKAHRQVFVICPLIDESDKLGVRSATKEYEKLSQMIFPKFKISLLHGRMKTKEKEAIMTQFASGQTDILVSTAVVEVGVDIPNATIMMIEGAERFGLAQLHQFRGRVGRGKYQSFCLLFTDSHDDSVIRRLNSLVACHDGFELAEQDLRLRGPGEIYGTRQSGYWDLRMASLTDIVTIKKARSEAQKMIDKGLKKYPALIEKIKAMALERRLE